MNTTLWAVQVFLALVFAGAGATKLLVPKERLGNPMPWVEDYSQRAVRIIGALEVLGAIGLIAPGRTDIAPILTVAAAAGLAATMVGGFVVHWRRREYARSSSNVVLFLLAAFVVVGRLLIEPF